MKVGAVMNCEKGKNEKCEIRYYKWQYPMLIRDGFIRSLLSVFKCPKMIILLILSFVESSRFARLRV